MGKETRSFRNTNKSQSGNRGASNFGQQNRGAWHQRLVSYFKSKGGGLNGKS